MRRKFNGPGDLPQERILQEIISGKFRSGISGTSGTGGFLERSAGAVLCGFCSWDFASLMCCSMSITTSASHALAGGADVFAGLPEAFPFADFSALSKSYLCPSAFSFVKSLETKTIRAYSMIANIVILSKRKSITSYLFFGLSPEMLSLMAVSA